MHNTEPLADDEADAVIEMDVREDLEHALSRAVDAVVRILELPRPELVQTPSISARRLPLHAAIGPRALIRSRRLSNNGHPPSPHDTLPYPPRST